MGNEEGGNPEKQQPGQGQGEESNDLKVAKEKPKIQRLGKGEGVDPVEQQREKAQEEVSEDLKQAKGKPGSPDEQHAQEKGS